MQGEMKNAHTFWLKNLKRRGHCDFKGIDGLTILKWFWQKQGVKVQTGFNYSETSIHHFLRDIGK
jgi:hypothetical protein